MAAKLLPSGLGVRYFAYQKHSFYLAMSGLDYGLTHNEIVLIAHLLLYKKGEESSDLIPKDSYERLLPEKKKLNALHSLLWLAHTLLTSRAHLDTFSFLFEDGVLTIDSPYLYLAQEQLQAFILPKNLSLKLVHS
jgi:exopolyphosphatase/guanosine-5'-triphosphate,3'-diphosphate pyrophosphatase